jgi:hypothetical protein
LAGLAALIPAHCGNDAGATLRSEDERRDPLGLVAGDDRELVSPRAEQWGARARDPCGGTAVAEALAKAEAMNHIAMDRELDLRRLHGAVYAGRRLARRRRVLGALLIIIGTPVVVLIRSTDPTVRHTLMGLALAWLALIVPMAGLLWVEWRNGRRADELRARIDN